MSFWAFENTSICCQLALLSLSSLSSSSSPLLVIEIRGWVELKFREEEEEKEMIGTLRGSLWNRWKQRVESCIDEKKHFWDLANYNMDTFDVLSLFSLSLNSATLLDNLKVLTELNCVFQQNYWMLDIHTIAQNKWSLVIKCSRPRKLQFFFFFFKGEFVILLVHVTCFLLCNFFKQWLEIIRVLEQFSTFV